MHHERDAGGVGALGRAHDGPEVEALVHHLGDHALHAALSAYAHGGDEGLHGREVVRLEVVGAHAVGHVEAHLERGHEGEKMVPVALVDVDELVEHFEARGAVLARHRGDVRAEFFRGVTALRLG